MFQNERGQNRKTVIYTVGYSVFYYISMCSLVGNFILLHVIQIILYLYIQQSPEDEPSRPKHVEDFKN